jgi:hypothetical protein
MKTKTKKPKKSMTIEHDRQSDIWEVTFKQDEQTAKRRYGSFTTFLAVIKEFFDQK